MSRFCCGALVAVALSGWITCDAQDTVTIGGVDLPAGCALARVVEDNYQKWAEDPRYEAWMTRPEYRKFLGKPRNREKGASP